MANALARRGNKEEKLECPDCLKEHGVSKEFGNKASLGSHRFSVHGVRGKYGKWKNEVRKEERVAKRQYRKRDTFHLEPNNGQGAIDERAVAYAVGSINGFLQELASRLCVPAPTLAFRVARLLHDSASGKVLGMR